MGQKRYVIQAEDTSFFVMNNHPESLIIDK